jgi:endoglucanase
MKKVITSALGLMLLLASCGSDPSKTVNLENMPAIKTQPEQQLKAASLGSGVKSNWAGKWTSDPTGRTPVSFNGVTIQGGIQAGTNIRYAFAHDGNVMTRTGKFGNTLTTAYLVRIPNTTKDHFEGWYANYNCEAGCKGTLAYFEMKRDTKSASIDGANWSGRFDPKPLGALVGGNFLLKTKAGIAAPGGTQNGTNIDYKIANGLIRRSGMAGGVRTSAEMLEVPGTGHYIGWYANSDSTKLGFFVAANKTPVTGGTQWSMLHEDATPANQLPTLGRANWTTDATGTAPGTTIKYTINTDRELFRSGASAHLLDSGIGSQNYMGWYTNGVNGSLNYFDVTRGSVQFKGASIAGLEFGTTYSGASNIPGVLNQDYFAPRNQDITTYRQQGMNTFRIPFRWERLQYAASDNGNPINTPGTDPKLNAQYLAELDRIISTATAQGANVILDMHNYGAYYRYTNASFNGYNDIGVPGSSVTSANLATIWYVIAARYKNNPRVMFGLMNEPLYENTTTLALVLQDSINAIRQSGASNPIIVNGNYFTGAWSWNNSYTVQINGVTTPVAFGLPNGTFARQNNATAMMSLKDDNLIYEAHQYFDPGFSGTPDNAECNPSFPSGDQANGILASDTIAQKVEKLFAPFTTSMRANSRRGFLGEIGVWPNANCQAYLEETLKYLEANSDVWIGWTYWAGGSKWKATNQMVLQVGDDYTSRPQLTTLKKFLP